MAAVRLLPFVFILSAMVLANGFFMAKFGRYGRTVRVCHGF